MGVGAHLVAPDTTVLATGTNLAGRGADAPPVNAQQQVITASIASPPRLWLWLWLWLMTVEGAVFTDTP